MATEPIILPQGPAAIPVSLEIVPNPRKKRSLLPVLILLFLLSYGLILSLVIFQGTTINAQRLLIFDLFRDSSQLHALQMKDSQKKHAAQPDKGKDTPQDKARAAKPKHRQHQLLPPQSPEGADFTDTRRTQVSI